HDDVEFRTVFQAFEDEVWPVAVPTLQASAVRAHVRFPCQPLGLERLVIGPLDGNPMGAGKRLDPLLVLLRARRQRLLRDRVDPMNVPEEVHDRFLACEERQISQDDDAIETVVYQGEQAAKQLVEGFHRSSSADACLSNTIMRETTDGDQ